MLKIILIFYKTLKEIMIDINYIWIKVFFFEIVSPSPIGRHHQRRAPSLLASLFRQPISLSFQPDRLLSISIDMSQLHPKLLPSIHPFHSSSSIS